MSVAAQDPGEETTRTGVHHRRDASGWHLLAMSCLELKSPEARISSRLAKVYAAFLDLVMTATVGEEPDGSRGRLSTHGSIAFGFAGEEIEIDYAVFEQPFDVRQLQAEVVFTNQCYVVLKLGATSEDSARQE